MSDEQKKIMELSRLVGLALGALKIIETGNFNQDGISMIIEELEKGIKHER